MPVIGRLGELYQPMHIHGDVPADVANGRALLADNYAASPVLARPEWLARVAARAVRRASRASLSCGNCLYAFNRRKPFLASIMPAAVQRRAIEASRQRFTFRVTWRIVPFMFSMMLVQASERRRSWGRPSRTNHRISSSPSRMVAEMPGQSFSRRRARF